MPRPSLPASATTCISTSARERASPYQRGRAPPRTRLLEGRERRRCATGSPRARDAARLLEQLEERDLAIDRAGPHLGLQRATHRLRNLRAAETFGGIEELLPAFRIEGREELALGLTLGLAQVHLEDRAAGGSVWQRHLHQTVEAAGPRKRRVD